MTKSKKPEFKVVKAWAVVHPEWGVPIIRWSRARARDAAGARSPAQGFRVIRVEIREVKR